MGCKARHCLHPFGLADDPVLVMVEDFQQSVHASDRQTVAGIVFGQLRPLYKGKAFGHFVALYLIVVIAVELLDGVIPGSGRIPHIISSSTQGRAACKQKPIARYRDADRFLWKAAGPPYLSTGRWIIGR